MPTDRDKGYIADIHCHALWGIDDGPASVDETLRMLRISAEEGITHVILTPHHRPGRFEADDAVIVKRFKEVSAAVKDSRLPLKLYPGREIYRSSDMAQKIHKHPSLRMNGTDFVLVEFQNGEQFREMRNALDNLMSQGYTPVLAHIEKYSCIVDRPADAAQLKALGVRIQVNAASVTGEAGFKVKRLAAKLLSMKIPDYIATDAHGDKHRPPHMKRCRSILYKKYDKDYVDGLLFVNAARDFGL